ncbi:hypothetical protein BH11MYX2_BH11MYX2_20380 [soil metagenome]
MHGFEHACISVLESAGHKAFEGRTQKSAFVVEIANDGRVSSDSVRAATTEAIARLVDGERALAFTPKCGTSLLVKVVLARPRPRRSRRVPRRAQRVSVSTSRNR